MLGCLTGFPIKCFGFGHWLCNLTRWQDVWIMMFTVLHSCTIHLFSHIKGTVLLLCECFRDKMTCKHTKIVLNMCKILNTAHSQWNTRLEFDAWLLIQWCDFPVYAKPKASKVSHLWFLWLNLCVCVSARVSLFVISVLSMGAWKKASTGLWNFAFVAQMRYEVTSGISHYEGMHCGCF